ncbi:MAG TPA: hypothetical protein VHH54_05815, partial [Actinomycetota bacterium]|nr:hypothetical protein [Actinomycetota bacterium]
GIPATLLLAVFSTRFGKLAARYGPRMFMAAGPMIMALGILWLARIPPDSQPWRFGLDAGERLLPPAGYWIDLFPAFVVFGLGLVIMVAPLTTALMTSVPKHNAGVASAINNAISRVGPQLAGALIFVAIAGSFYGSLADRVPGLDTSSQEVRNAISPLNRPADQVSPEVLRAVRESSTNSFRLAMLISSALLLAGAVVNGIGIKNRQQTATESGPEAASSVPSPSPTPTGVTSDQGRSPP